MYVSAAEFEAKVGTRQTIELTNLDDVSANIVNISKLESALVDASREVDGYLSTRYDTPLTNVPGTIQVYVVDIAWYRLAQNNVPDSYSTRYESAIARLKDIEQGKMLLVGNDGVVIPKRKESNKLVDERGQELDDWTMVYQPGGTPQLTREKLDLLDIYRHY